MAEKTSELITKIRERMTERAMSGAPYWAAPVNSSARDTAGCLLIGTLLNKVPSEDASELCKTLAREQNADGSWSRVSGDPGDMSLTLEVVEALSEARRPASTDMLDKAVGWLKTYNDDVRIQPDTAILLRALNDLPRTTRERWLGSIGRSLLRFSKLRSPYYVLRPAMREALQILSLDRATALGRSRELLELQYIDGSWDGETRSTILAMAALRHTGLSIEDSVFERAWRFLSSNQAWRNGDLVQNPCDTSNLLHATALRTLIMTGAEPDVAATSIFTLLHHQRTSGGWAVGGMLPTDLFTTALGLDALSFAGDLPVETLWARRRAVLLLTRVQNRDGGWPLIPASRRLLFSTPHIVGRKFARSRADVTALVVQSLAYSGVQEQAMDGVIERGVRYLLRTQRNDGMWAGDSPDRDVFTTSRAIEALLGSTSDRSRGPVTKAVRALLRQQREDGGWGTTHDTAWVVRALAGMPGVPVEVLNRGRAGLENAINRDDLTWPVNGAELPLPAADIAPGNTDLSTLWALEALAPVSSAAKKRRLAGRKSRSVSDRKL